MVAIAAKIRKFSLLRRLKMLVAVGRFFVVYISVRFMFISLQVIRQSPTTPSVQIIIHPSLCEEGPTTNISTTSLSISTPERQRGDYPHYHHISQIVEGPALTASNFEHAICKYRHITYSHHFPHTMQQMYRCWSWWIAHPDKQPILIFQHTRKTRKNSFVISFFEVLQKQINLKIVRSHDGPYVQAKDTGMWDNDIEITDYAMLDPERKLRQVFAEYIRNVAPDPPCDRKNLATQQSPKVAILNRAETTGRSLLNAKEIARSIEDTFAGQKVSIVYFENKTMLEQVQFFMETDIVISPHGAQLTSIAFMKNCSTLIEFFPQAYLTVDFFGSLAASVGVNHKYFYLGNNEKQIEPYERYHYIPTMKFRGKNQCPKMDTVMTGLVDVIQSWRPCCSVLPPTPINKSQRYQPTKRSSVMRPNIDIVTVGSLSRKAQLDTQKQTFGSHRTVRHFYPITELNDAERNCSADLKFDQYQKIISACRSVNGQSEMSRKIRTDLFQPMNNSTEWLCAQKRAIDGLHFAMEKYQSRTSTIPDYLVLIDDDTYLNMDVLVKTLQESYSPDDNHLVAGCTYLGIKKSHFVYPVDGLGIFFTRATIEKIIQPIHCQSTDKSMDPFVKWACWRLDQNLIGEKQFFKEGMSVGDLMFAFASGLPFTGVDEWDGTGYCFHGNHAIAYFLNYYHVSVPDWLLNETTPTDTLRMLFSFKKIADSMDDGTGKGLYRGSECGNLFNKCTVQSRVCHPLTSEQMTMIYWQHRSSSSK